ncbi:Uncharacterised protein at_DN0865 [Pycnogonum litorale]
MERTRQAGVTLNQSKCVIKSDSCKYFGMIFTREGIKPDNEKVRAITEMKPPTNKKELQTFLGMTNYLNSFMRGLAIEQHRYENYAKMMLTFIGHRHMIRYLSQ